MYDDESRCLGERCAERETCERYRQIERDRQRQCADPPPPVVWLSHVATWRLPGQAVCLGRIKVQP